MNSVEEFLAYAIKLEEEAMLRFDQLADAMQSYGNKDVGSLFRRLSDYSRMHLGDARARAGFRNIPVMLPDAYKWPDLESPETAAIWAADPFLAKNEALEVALASETAGYEFYKSVHDGTDDPEIRVLAAEFFAEEAEHVAWINQWIEEERTNGGPTEATLRGIVMSN
ncbi:ferritin-like domain-containing protein [Bradyrhizobium roseum]|uniref:ferritin-like domain-containing protein n=1 Tax=Bradyrhizobium roseum TaxID=3056648 RepID=UPI0026090176|nr:ferritin family protein [Bradyrhizobium roseus]WKA31178.1 ferritin family protein [Bradyrhizobium roseus]